MEKLYTAICCSKNGTITKTLIYHTFLTRCTAWTQCNITQICDTSFPYLLIHILRRTCYTNKKYNKVFISEFA